MPLSSGVRLGIYEVFELIGMGGMGEVYRARDSRLNRDVAVKVLPALVAADPDRLARFKREAQVLASLNHSSIGAIYGFEESADVQALILELVDGPTLADRIAEGRIPLDEALAIATQIAEALEAAHERGIVHRDLKPANIKVRPNGRVKVLDFGLAKALATNSAASDASVTPTITSPALTRLGVILGTAAYMSPEQARGKEADKRSDIWAFGCVLYEMLSGRKAFDGSEVSDALASILKSDPDWSALPADTPSGIRRVLRRCLEKDPRRRFHDIADVRLELEELPAQDIAGTLSAAAATNRRRERAAWALVAVCLVLLASLIAYVTLKPAPAAAITRFHVYPPPNTVLGSGSIGLRGSSAIVSPDGTRLVLVATDRAGKSQLWIRAFDSFDALPLTGTDGASLAFWSPDARWVGFFVGNKLMTINAAGGSPRTICSLADDVPRGGTWGSAGDIVFSSGNSPRLYRVSDQGGAPVPLATDETLTREAFWPRFLPDGHTFLYWARDAGANGGVYAGSIGEGARTKKVLTTRTAAAYDPAGFLLFTSGSSLLRQRFDPTRLEVSGETRPVAEGVATNTSMGLGAFSVSANGVLVFEPEEDLSSQLAWFDRAGRMLETVGDPGKYRYPALSPDGSRLAYTNLADGNLWIFDMSRRISSKFTTGAGVKVAPVWSPDGGSIFYRKMSGDSDPSGFYEKIASGGAEEKLFFKGSVNGPQQISPDGKWLLYFANSEGESVQDIYVLPMTGDRKPQRIVQSPFADVEPQFSPDGRFVAYVSGATGRNEVYVQPFPAPGEQFRVSDSGGRQPLWRKDGKELFFVSDDRKFYAVEITPGPRFDYGRPKFLFEMRANVFNTRNSYIPSADGQRFLVNMALDTSSPPIHVVRNWTAGLKD